MRHREKKFKVRIGDNQVELTGLSVIKLKRGYLVFVPISRKLLGGVALSNAYEVGDADVEELVEEPQEVRKSEGSSLSIAQNELGEFRLVA